MPRARTTRAINGLNDARNLLDPADYGLALALAGQPQAAVSVLDGAARQVGADARVRQNLALAHALGGDWEMARTVASQDVAADQLDARIQQWMTFAKPAKASDQVASLTGFRARRERSRTAGPAGAGTTRRIKCAWRRPIVPESAPPVEAAPPLVRGTGRSACSRSGAEPVADAPVSKRPTVEAEVTEPAPVAVAAAAPVAVVEQARAYAEAVAAPVVESR